ncbi:hypothetical protein [Chengkuizengella axinellae]|uniref:DUF4430 domain-containing protein n=1 Tax=Chengkuizengella axinellae TaxID=3064388 RepID=A0ABT9J6H6_9BACL|nr:hypothetical protein [Chengkuizengella sp. 2205SS18-9]MDP5276600.1 hypothetical protein [Chengkuizengella sp. 2205SS18-9]
MEKRMLVRLIRITGVVSSFIILLVMNIVQYNQNQSIYDLNEYLINRLQLVEGEKSTLLVEKKEVNKDISEVKQENDNLINEIARLNTDIENLGKIDFASIQELSQFGIDTEYIIKDLYDHPELIPFDGVFGGTMFFYKAYVLNYKWVYAKFEDGHILGAGLYKFELDQHHNISWELVDAFLYSSK